MNTPRLLGPPALGCPIAPMPFTPHQWASMPPAERRRHARQWYAIAQPIPLQRGWMPAHTRISGRNLWLRTQFALRLLGGLQHGKRATVDLIEDLEAARARAATLSGEVDEACNTVLELSALALADRDYAKAPTKALAVCTPRPPRRAAS